MLEPDNRHLLLDALRPPFGTQIDAAVGTTFSLDLEALLLAPVSFALFEARLAETGDPERADPLAVMEAVRRHASRIDLFCQAGQISVPPRERPVLALLEDSVHPTATPTPGHIFHPKLWCLRFRDIETDQPTYRLLVLSRNLTFDRSWDTVVVLDGEPGKPSRELSRQNGPLVDFLSTLPDLATRELPYERRQRIEELAGELLQVNWELPYPFTLLRFLPSGIGEYRTQMPARVDRALVISPFLTAGQLTQLADTSGPTTLVSRPESLDLIDMDILDRFAEVFVLVDSADETPPDDAGEVTGSSEETGERPSVATTGMHAKVIVADQGWDTEFRTGSTNITTAGWGGNVEFDVAFIGPRSRGGVTKVLGLDAKSEALHTLLRRYERSQREPLPESETERLAYDLERLGREVASLRLMVRVEPNEELYRMLLTSDRPLPHADGVSIRCWPISRKPDTAVTLKPGAPVHVSHGSLSLQRLTSFFVFELEGQTSEGAVTTRVVANAHMVGAPEDRAQQLLLDQLKNKGDVLRYLLFLLADLGDDAAVEFAAVLSRQSGETNGEWTPQIPLFESMVRALARNPAALAPVDRLIRDLQATKEGREILPDGIEDIWPAIWEARSRVV